MENKYKLDLGIVKVYNEILKKENSILHYNKYAYTLLNFEKYLKDNDLIISALDACEIKIDEFQYTKEKLQDYKRTFKDINNELTFKAYYQMFEEFIFQVLNQLYSTYPIFLKNDSGKFDVMYENIFETSDVIEIRNFIIERKIKSILQANNITNTLKKIKKVFGLDIKISVEDSQELFRASLKRNILTHNNGIVNGIYIQELTNQQLAIENKLGDSIYPQLNKSRKTLAKVVNSLSLTIHNCIRENLVQLDKYASSLEKNGS